MCTRKGKWVGFGRSASSDSEGCGCTPKSGCILMRLSMSVVIRRCMEYLCSNVISDMCISDVPYLGLLLCVIQLCTLPHPRPTPHLILCHFIFMFRGSTVHCLLHWVI